MIVISMPIERAASRLIHPTTATWTAKRRRHSLTYCHRMFSFATTTAAAKHQELHNTPDTTDFTESNTDLAKGPATGIPPLIGDGDGATIPTTGPSTGFALGR